MKLVKDTDNLQNKKHQVSDEKAEEAIKTIIQWIGENPDREGLKSTPTRVIKAFREYFGGYTQDPKKFLSNFGDKYLPSSTSLILSLFLNINYII